VSDKIIDAAVAIELEHLATLYHDDIMDKAEKRRGVIAAHKKFGESVAILIGDYLFACAFRLGANLGKKVILEQSKTLYTLCVGQIYDVLSEQNKYNVSLKIYIKVIEQKTASLVSSAMFIGASLSGATTSQIKNLKEFGYNYGIAFQLKDDLLDIDLIDTGKSKGTDLKNHVLTLPVLLLKSKYKNNINLINMIDSDFLDDKKVIKIAKLIRNSNAYNNSVDIIKKYINNAISSLAHFKQTKCKSMLIDKANELIK
jgi:heptaprenyl diphosphate synthase